MATPVSKVRAFLFNLIFRPNPRSHPQGGLHGRGIEGVATDEIGGRIRRAAGPEKKSSLYCNLVRHSYSALV